MKRHLLTSFSLLFLVLTIVAQDLNTYYGNADGKYKAGLKAALKGIIANHTPLGYGNLWAAYEQVDYIEGKINSDGQYQVFDYYSDSIFYFKGNGTAVTGMNKEHVAPQSWWGKGTNIPVGNDLIQVIPAEENANTAKNNYPLGIVKGTPMYPNNDSGLAPRIKTGSDINGQPVFEPCDEYKGDFARIYFYVATCYPDVNWEERSDVNVSFKKEDYPTLKADIIDTLLQWHRQDPVSEWEQTRNNRVYPVQKNRNPFVDYPELAEYIWGNKTNEVFYLNGTNVGSNEETPSSIIFDFSSNEWELPVGSANKTADVADYTKDGYTITVAGSPGEGYYWHTGGYLIMGKNGAYLTLPAFENAVDNIVVYGHAGASASVIQNIYVGNTAVSTATTGAATPNSGETPSMAIINTYEIAEDYQAAGNVYTLRISSSHNTQVLRIAINFKPITVEQQYPDFDFAYETETDFQTPYSLNSDSITGGPATLSITPSEAATVSSLSIAPVYAGKIKGSVSTAETKYYYADNCDFMLTVAQPQAIGGCKVNAQAEILFEERFSQLNGTGGHDNGYTGSVAGTQLTIESSTDETWTEATKIYIGKECAKIGTSSVNGILTSSPIILTGNGILTFSAAGWGGSNTNTLTVTATGGTLSGDTDITLNNGSWSDYAIDITDVTDTLVLTFSGKRGFIDDIVVTSVNSSSIANETITLNADGLTTFASNYTLDLTNADDDGYSAWKAAEVRGDQLILTPVTGIVPAGTPLIIKGEANAELSLPTTDAEPTADVDDNLLSAILATTVVWNNEYMKLDGQELTTITSEYSILTPYQAILSTDMLDENYEGNTLTLVFSTTDFVLGDVNNDGLVTIADVTALVNIILGKTNEYDIEIADVNGDQAVTIADVTALVNIILGKE